MIPNNLIKHLINPPPAGNRYWTDSIHDLVESLFLACSSGRSASPLTLRLFNGKELLPFTQAELCKAILDKTVLLSNITLLIIDPLNTKKTQKCHIIELINQAEIIPVNKRIEHFVLMLLHEPAALFYNKSSIFNPWMPKFLGEEHKLSAQQIIIITRILACYDYKHDLMVSNLMIDWLYNQSWYPSYEQAFLQLLLSKDDLETGTGCIEHNLKVLVTLLGTLPSNGLEKLVDWLENRPNIYSKLNTLLLDDKGTYPWMKHIKYNVYYTFIEYGHKLLMPIVAMLEHKQSLATEIIVDFCHDERLGFDKTLHLVDRICTYSLLQQLYFWQTVYWAAVQEDYENLEKNKNDSHRDKLLLKVLEDPDDNYVMPHFTAAIDMIPLGEMISFLMQKNIRVMVAKRPKLLNLLKDKAARKAPSEKESQDLESFEIVLFNLMYEKDSSHAITLALKNGFAIKNILLIGCKSYYEKDNELPGHVFCALLSEFNLYWERNANPLEIQLQINMLYLMHEEIPQQEKSKKSNKKVKDNKSTLMSKFHDLFFNESNNEFFSFCRRNIFVVADILLRQPLFLQRVFDKRYSAELDFNFKLPLSNDLLTLLTSDQISLEILWAANVFDKHELANELLKSRTFNERFFKKLEQYIIQDKFPDAHNDSYSKYCKTRGHAWLHQILTNKTLLPKLIHLELFDLYDIQKESVFNGKTNHFKNALEVVELKDLYRLRDQNQSELTSGHLKGNKTLQTWQAELRAYIELRETKYKKDKTQLFVTILNKSYQRAQNNFQNKDDRIQKRAHAMSSSVHMLLTQYPTLSQHAPEEMKPILNAMENNYQQYQKGEKDTLQEVVSYYRLQKKLVHNS